MEIKTNQFGVDFNAAGMLERTTEFFAKSKERKALKDKVEKAIFDAANRDDAFLYSRLVNYLRVKYFQMLSPVFMGFGNDHKIDVQYSYFMLLTENEYFNAIRREMSKQGLTTLAEDWLVKEWADSFIVRPFEIVE